MADLLALNLKWVQTDGGADWTPRQLALLGVVCCSPGPHRVRDLARRLRLQKPVITRATSKLADAGLVQRVRNVDDLRDIDVQPTTQGVAFCLKLRGLGA